MSGRSGWLLKRTEAAMRGYDLLKQWDGLTEQQRRDSLSWFLGGLAMDEEGWRDSKERPNYGHAVFALNSFDEAMQHVRWQADNPGTRTVSGADQRLAFERPAPDPVEVVGYQVPMLFYWVLIAGVVAVWLAGFIIGLVR